MTYDEIKALLAKLENFRQLVQVLAEDGTALVCTDNQDHLLREAILCIEELEQRGRREPARYYSSTRGIFDGTQIDPKIVQQYYDVMKRAEMYQYQSYKQDVTTFAGLAKMYGGTQGKYYKNPPISDPCLD